MYRNKKIDHDPNQGNFIYFLCHLPLQQKLGFVLFLGLKDCHHLLLTEPGLLLGGGGSGGDHRTCNFSQSPMIQNFNQRPFSILRYDDKASRRGQRDQSYGLNMDENAMFDRAKHGLYDAVATRIFSSHKKKSLNRDSNEQDTSKRHHTFEELELFQRFKLSRTSSSMEPNLKTQAQERAKDEKKSLNGSMSYGCNSWPLTDQKVGNNKLKKKKNWESECGDIDLNLSLKIKPNKIDDDGNNEVDSSLSLSLSSSSSSKLSRLKKKDKKAASASNLDLTL